MWTALISRITIESWIFNFDVLLHSCQWQGGICLIWQTLTVVSMSFISLFPGEFSHVQHIHATCVSYVVSMFSNNVPETNSTTIWLKWSFVFFYIKALKSYSTEFVICLRQLLKVQKNQNDQHCQHKNILSKITDSQSSPQDNKMQRKYSQRAKRKKDL